MSLPGDVPGYREGGVDPVMKDALLVILILSLPVMAFLILREKHLLHAIIGRGMLGILAAVAYAFLGAPDVAITEALMGALLVTLLYVVVFVSAGEFRVGYVELPPLIQQKREELEGYMVELLRAFGTSVGLTPRFIPFSSREELLDELQNGVMDLAIGSFVDLFDCRESCTALPVVETRVMAGGKGQWVDILRARTAEEGFPGEFPPGWKVSDASYSVLVSEDAHDLQEMVSAFMENDGRQEVIRLRQKYLGE